MTIRHALNRITYRLRLKRRPARGLLQFADRGAIGAAARSYDASAYDPEAQMKAFRGGLATQLAALDARTQVVARGAHDAIANRLPVDGGRT